MVWMELLEIFRSGDPMKVVADEFMDMLKITHQMGQIVYPHVFDNSLSLDESKQIMELDIKVNKLERSVRKRVISHLTMNRTHIPYCILLMSLVKDAERIGDYVKNISEVSELGGGPIPEGPLRDELADLINIANQLFHETPLIISAQDRERAAELLRIKTGAAKRCDKLLVELAKSDLKADQATSMVLLTRFHKRLTSHLANILTSVVMPVHKVDFFDEKYLKDKKPS
jgi:phosphate transport system protein